MKKSFSLTYGGGQFGLTNVCRTLLGVVVYLVTFLVVPSAPPADKHGKIDWIGAYLGVAALILFTFVWV